MIDSYLDQIDEIKYSNIISQKYIHIKVQVRLVRGFDFLVLRLMGAGRVNPSLSSSLYGNRYPIKTE